MRRTLALRALSGSRGSLLPRLLSNASRLCSSTVTKAESASTSTTESASASASEHAVTNAANANVTSRTWDEHRLTKDQMQFRDLASVSLQFDFYHLFVQSRECWTTQWDAFEFSNTRPWVLCNLVPSQGTLFDSSITLQPVEMKIT